jgi:hypothetical protein
LINIRILKSFLFITGICFSILLSGCSVQHHLLQNAGDLLSKESSASEDDLELIKYASAYHLKVSESVLSEIPDHVKLSEAVTRGFTQYAFVFLMDEADRTETQGIQQATLLRARAAKMLLRAKAHGHKTLTMRYPQLDTYLMSNKTEHSIKLSSEDAGLAYWTMTSWAGAISLSKDNPDIVADLPQVINLASLIWRVDPKFDNGALASMMGTLELAKPGGKIDMAEKYFDMAIEWRKDQVAPLVSKAENWAVTAQNKEAFKFLLQKAINTSGLQNSLSNTVMVRRAQWLLDSIDNLF